MSIRTRRLKADYEKMSGFFTGEGRIRVIQTLGAPPEKYEIEFLVSSLQKDLRTQQLKLHNHFVVEITLLSSYPRLAPQCRMLTPVFHPNIAPNAICIGDHWAAGESLPNLVIRIAEMLAYQSYNVKSPLNGEAAKWVESHGDQLPLDPFDFASLLDAGDARGSDVQTCANCGRRVGPDETFQTCVEGHVACPECLVKCGHCQKPICLKCSIQTCSVCGARLCAKCAFRCAVCHQTACLNHGARCHVCRRAACLNCLVTCAECGRAVCVDHIRRLVRDNERVYVCGACEAAEESNGERRAG